MVSGLAWEGLERSRSMADMGRVLARHIGRRRKNYTKRRNKVDAMNYAPPQSCLSAPRGPLAGVAPASPRMP